MTGTLIQLHQDIQASQSPLEWQAANFSNASSMVEVLVWWGFTQTRDTLYCLSCVVFTQADQ